MSLQVNFDISGMFSKCKFCLLVCRRNCASEFNRLELLTQDIIFENISERCFESKKFVFKSLVLNLNFISAKLLPRHFVPFPCNLHTALLGNMSRLEDHRRRCKRHA
jgi:hypothetical protein